MGWRLAWLLSIRSSLACIDVSEKCNYYDCPAYSDGEKLQCLKTCDICGYTTTDVPTTTPSHHGEEYQERLEVAHEIFGHEPSGNAVAKAIAFFVIAFPCLLFTSMYLLQSPNPKVRSAMWILLNGMVSLLIAVVFTQFGIAIIEFQVLAGAEPGFSIKIRKWIMVSCGFLALVLLMFLISFASYYNRNFKVIGANGELRLGSSFFHMKALTSLLGQLAGFAGVHAFGTLFFLCQDEYQDSLLNPKAGWPIPGWPLPLWAALAASLLSVGLLRFVTIRFRLCLRERAQKQDERLEAGEVESGPRTLSIHGNPSRHFTGATHGGQGQTQVHESCHQHLSWTETAVEAEDEAFALTFGFLFLQYLMYHVHGRLLPLEVETEDHDMFEMTSMGFSVIVAASVVVFFTIWRAYYVKSVADDTVWWYRGIVVCHSTVGMFGAWTLIFTSSWFVRWHLVQEAVSGEGDDPQHRIFLLLPEHGDVHVQKSYGLEQVVNACILTLAAVAITRALVSMEELCFDAKQDMYQEGAISGKSLKQMLTFTAFIVGVSWDKAFSAADQTIVNAHPILKQHYCISKAFIGVLLPLLVYPAWVKFIVPRAVLRPGHKNDTVDFEDQEELLHDSRVFGSEVKRSSHQEMIEMEQQQQWAAPSAAPICWSHLGGSFWRASLVRSSSTLAESVEESEESEEETTTVSLATTPR